MIKKPKQTKRFLSISMLSAMLLNTALPSSLTHVFAASNPVQQSVSTGTFTADEVNRILAGLTDEQKANINKLTGAEHSQKIHVNPADLRSSNVINVIIQFKEDPAKIQIIKQALANGGATLNSQAFANEYATAQKKVTDSHANFKRFLDSQPKSQIIGGTSVNTSMRMTREYSGAFNGVSLSLPANLITTIAENAEVASIWPSETFEVPETRATDGETSGFGGKATSGLKLMGLDKLQAEGHTGIIQSGPNKGKKVKVGVLDTGIDYNHPDLYKVTHNPEGKRYGGHDFVNAVIDENGNVTYVDDNDPMETIYSDWVEAKANPSKVLDKATPNYKSYITSHGTHVSGTIAANTTDNNATYSANGVAPDVELHGYRVLGPGGHGSGDSILKGVDQAVQDGMQVINMSLGSSTNNPVYPTSIAVNNATLVGVTCIVSAGNNGPGVATLGSPGSADLAITIGASTVPLEIPVMTLQYGTTPYQVRLFGKSFLDSNDAFAGQTYPIVDVGLGDESDYEGKNVSGKLVLVKRGGGINLSKKMSNAKASGAKGMMVWNNIAEENNQGYMTSSLGSSMDNIYSVSLTQAQGQALVEAIKVDPSKAMITFPSTLDPSFFKKADELAGFSSTGPVKNYDLKPDIISPGVDIISTVPFDVWEPQDGQTHDYTYAYESMQGTSMAAPHAAGIAALVLAAHPDYKPADIKTALMNTAKDMNTESTTYSVYQVGAGRVDPGRAIKADVKIQVLDKANHYDDPRYIYESNPIMRQIDDITGAIFFGFKGRGEGATNGSDDVVSSKDFNVINQGTESKTFNVQTTFLSTKFAESNPVGPGTGNDAKVDVSVNNDKTTSIQVGGKSTVKATAQITIPANALEGTYEGYLNLVNASDASDSYRIPFTITIAEKGIDFGIDKKAMTLGERYTGNVNVNGTAPGSFYHYSINSEMKSMYLLLKDKEGNYVGVVQNVTRADVDSPGVIYTYNQMLVNGYYLPFTKTYNGELDQTGIAKSPVAIKEGAYSVEAIATDAAGKQYRAEDTIYVDYTAPTLTMEPDSKPGIYEIDPAGYQAGQEMRRFYGTVLDSNIDVMKTNGETSIPNLGDLKPMPVNQGLNTVYAYQDSIFLSSIFKTDANGRFYFGLAPEDVTSKGSEVRIYPEDYSGAGDIYSQQRFYFIKKGSPYVTLTSSGGVDPVLDGQGKPVVEPNIPFKATIATKNGIGMTGGTFTINNSRLYAFSHIRLSAEYEQYLTSKGITPTLTVSAPHPETEVFGVSGESTDITISGIDAAGALDQDMNILEADVTYIHPDPLVGPYEFKVIQSSFTLAGHDTKVPAFLTNLPYLKQPKSMMTGGILAEAFKVNNLNGSLANITVESGAKATVTNDKGQSFSTDSPTASNNTVEYLGKSTGTFAVSMPASDKPYQVEISMPGHFKGYVTSPVVGSNRWGYPSGGYYDFANVETPQLIGGDVNGDNVIDMNDLLAEIEGYNGYKALTTTATKKAFLTNPVNRKYDIRWVSTTGFGGYGIDYYDFYFIFKNFGLVNQSALKAGLTVSTPQLTLTADTMVNGVQLKAGDGVEQVRAALKFAGATQKLTPTTVPKLEELRNGAKITLIPTDSVFLDDVLWRNAITEIDLNGIDVTNTLIPNTSDKAVTRSAGNYYFDPYTGPTLVPAKITLDGSLFPTTGNYTVTIKAAGYQDVTVPAFTVAETPIPTPEIPLVTDPSKAHLGKDLTYTFTEDTNWQNGINKIVVKTRDFAAGVDITNLTDGSGQKYYDISQPGQITFKKELFRTDAATVANTSPIVPGAAKDLPQQYKFEINSTGANGTIYPLVTAGTYKGDTTQAAAQSIGYSVHFDTQGGAPLQSVAIGYRADRTKYGTAATDFPLSQTAPVPTRPGYVFQGWWNEPACTTAFYAPAVLTADKTIYAKWKMNVTQNYSLADVNNPNGAKFDGILVNGSSASGKGWVLGEGDLELTIPDYQTNFTWLTNKSSIASIQATYYKVKSDGTADSVTTTYTLDPSTYDLIINDNGSATLSFTTATESYASEHPNEKFAFSALPAVKNPPFKGYQLTLTSTGGQSTTIDDIQLGYRRHIDLNGGTLKVLNSPRFWDTLVNGKATAPDMSNALDFVTNGDQSVSPTLYLDSKGSSNMASLISNTNGIRLYNNNPFYLCWIKTPPTVSKDTLENVVGTDITLMFTDDGTWKNNIKHVMIGSKELVPTVDYTLTDDTMTLDRTIFKAGQKVNVVIASEGYADVVVKDQVIGYKVTFEANGGEAVASQIVDSRVTVPAEPTMAGSKFAGWYTDQALKTPFDFTSIVTQPITLYAKYALAGSVVTADTTDNALGNDMTLEYSDVDWVKVVTGIEVNGSSVDQTKYSVDPTTKTIKLDKSLFTKAGTFTIVIRATDYADVTVSQKVVNGYNVNFVLPSDAPDALKDVVKYQIVSRRITEPTVHGYDLTWFADADCTIPWDFTSSIYSAKTLYGKWSLHKFSVVFDSQDGSLVESKTANYTSTITTPAEPTRPGHAFLGWYKDTTGKEAWNFAADKVTEDTRLYAKWAAGVENNGLYNKNVNIMFAEATANLDGNDYTSGTTVISEGNHTLVVTDAAGNATTIQFTIDKTAPIVSGVLNNGSYNHYVTLAFNETNALLNGTPIVNNYTVSNEGDYTLFVKDQAGNSTTVNFTIDKTAPVVTGVENNGHYKNDVTVTFSEGTATLNGDVIANGMVVDKDGTYAVIVTDKAGNISTTKFTIDKTAPIVTGVSNNGVYKIDVTVNFNEGTATLSGASFTSGTVVSKEGAYTLIVTDQAGNVTTVAFMINKSVTPPPIDNTPPVVTGVSNNGLYNHEVTISFNEGTAKLNGVAFTNGTVVNNEGTYTLIVTDFAGNVTTVKFTLDKTAPIVTGISNNARYNKDVTVTFNEGTATLNGKVVTSGTVVSTEGSYTLIVKDQAGNTSTVRFMVDKTAPVVSGVSNNGLYKRNVILSFNELGALLNGKPIASGTVVSKDGTYTLVVRDLAGNVTTVKFTIDKTAPLAPTVSKVTTMTTKVTGKAEAGSTVYLKVGTKAIGIATADKYGNYTVTIPKQKAGTILYVTAKDKAGNVSAATKVTVSK